MAANPSNLPRLPISLQFVVVSLLGMTTGTAEGGLTAADVVNRDVVAADGDIGSVADNHYSFMGATDPEKMKPAAEAIAGHMAAEGVDAVVLLPV